MYPKIITLQLVVTNALFYRGVRDSLTMAHKSCPTSMSPCEIGARGVPLLA